MYLCMEAGGGSGFLLEAGKRGDRGSCFHGAKRLGWLRTPADHRPLPHLDKQNQLESYACNPVFCPP